MGTTTRHESGLTQSPPPASPVLALGRPRATFRVVWLIVAGFLALVGGVVAKTLFDDYRTIQTTETDRLASQAKVVHDNIADYLANIKQVLTQVRGQVPAWRQRDDGMAAANRWFTVLDEAMPVLRTLTVQDENGLMIASNRRELVGIDFRQRPYFAVPRAHPNPDTLYVTPPFKTSLGVWTMIVAMIVPGPAGDFAGVVTATIDPEAFKVLLGSVRYAPDLSVGLNHGDGVIFLTEPPGDAQYGLNLKGLGGFFDRHVESGRPESRFEGVMRATNRPRMAALRTIQPARLAMDKALMVVVSRDLDSVYAPWRRDAWTQGGLYGLLLLVSLASVVVLQWRSKIAGAEAARAETARRENEERHRLFFNSGNDAIFVLRVDPETGLPSGPFVEVNDVACQRLGYRRDELLAKTAFDIDDPAMPTDDAHVRSLAERETAIFERLHVAKDGRRIPVEINARRFEFRGEPMVLATVRDITERKALEDELRRSNADLEQFAYVASHDLREPLRTVASFVTLLERKYGDRLDSDGREFIAFARDGAQRMDGLVLDLLDYSRVGRSNEPQAPVPLAEALDEALRNLATLIETNGATIETATDLPTLWGVRGELVRLFQNLIANALKYRAPDRPPRVTIGAERQGRQWVVTVTDNGIGIEPQHLERIFGIFKRLHTAEDYDGSGIGLAVCKKIVERHRGRIWASSVPGQGSTFHVALPADPNGKVSRTA
ncbi:MAG: PAS domain S-box protein [Rhodospirillales bacterium]|nr:PAS domain S-box protein [Rhodospirillales bacterium]